MKHRIRPGMAAVLAVGFLACMTPGAWGTTIQPLTIVDLLKESTVIVHGKIRSATDRVTQGIPATEVILDVEETFKGGPLTEFSFIQFGNAAPVAEPGGYVRLTGAPGGFPTYREGEEVILFMGPASPHTGLRSALGLGIGSFKISATRVRNDFENSGLFTNVEVANSAQTEELQSMMATTEGAYDAEAFVDFVRNATSEEWISNGLLTVGGGAKGGGRNVPLK